VAWTLLRERPVAIMLGLQQARRVCFFAFRVSPHGASSRLGLIRQDLFAKILGLALLFLAASRLALHVGLLALLFGHLDSGTRARGTPDRVTARRAFVAIST
jgi:hypothetical protein